MKNRKGKKMKKTKVMAGILCAVALIAFSACGNILNNMFGFNDDEKNQTSISDNPLDDDTTGDVTQIPSDDVTQTPPDDDYDDDDVTYTVYVCKDSYKIWKSFIKDYDNSQDLEIEINTGDGGVSEDSDDFYTLLDMLSSATTKEWSRRQIQTYLKGAGDPNAEAAAKEICSYTDEYVFYVFRESETDAYYVLKTVLDVVNSRVFNVTTSSDFTWGPVSEKPDWNLFFPPVLNLPFNVYKGKVDATKNKFNESTAKNKEFSSSFISDYENNADALINDFYVETKDGVYLSSEDTDGYAYRIKSQKSSSKYIVSKIIYPEDIIKIECKKFEYSKGEFSWDIEFSEEPDCLYFVGGTSDNIAYKSAWKFPLSPESNYSVREELDSSATSYSYDADYSTYVSIFAKYGNYYVRVTPLWNSKTRVFNIITSSDVTSIDELQLTSTPNWNVFFPPVLNWDFTVYKGKVDASTNEYIEDTVKDQSFFRTSNWTDRSRGYGSSGSSSALSHDYGDAYWAHITTLYAASSEVVYLSPDDTGGYAYRIKSQKSGADDVISDLIYPEDIVKIECKKFEYSDNVFSWEIEFSEEPDCLYFMEGNSDNTAYKSVWKFPNYFESSGSFLKKELTSTTTSYPYNFSSNSYNNYYVSLFAKYGDYCVRVSPSCYRSR